MRRSGLVAMSYDGTNPRLSGGVRSCSDLSTAALFRQRVPLLDQPLKLFSLLDDAIGIPFFILIA